MIIKFDKALIYDELFDIVNDSYLKTKILYYINSNVKSSVDLKRWLNTILQNNIDIEIPTRDNYDLQVIECLKYVKNNIKYKGDINSWNTTEYWQTPQETLDRLTGDCEDGAILMYILCRLKGIPANRLLIFCGSVNGGGHCWLGYKPQEYPLNFVFLDWCYWYNNNSVELRNKFYIHNNIIYEYSYDSLKNSNYYNIWFAFNENTNITKYRYDPKIRGYGNLFKTN